MLQHNANAINTARPAKPMPRGILRDTGGVGDIVNIVGAPVVGIDVGANVGYQDGTFVVGDSVGISVVGAPVVGAADVGSRRWYQCRRFARRRLARRGYSGSRYDDRRLPCQRRRRRF